MSNNRGGARPGAGRKARTDDRVLRLMKVALTDEEHIEVLALTTDERRDALLTALREKEDAHPTA